jgi:hypothetical protein
MTSRPTSPTDAMSSLRHTLDSLDVPSLRATFAEQNEFLFVQDLLPPDVVDACAESANALAPHVHRAYVPGYKKSGAVSYFRIRRHQPALSSLYRSPDLRHFLESLIGRALHYCPDDDPHSCALFYYDRPGDHIGFHRDSCHYRQGVVYTVLIGLVDESSARLECCLYDDLPGREPESLQLVLGRGGSAIFNGCNVRHRVTPIGPDERRIVLSMEFLLDPQMSKLRRFAANVDHAYKYFGFNSVLEAYRKP